jgi:hypothetical protein
MVWQEEKRVRVYRSHRDDGGLQLWSPDVEEFYLSGEDHGAVLHDMFPALERLLDWNHGLTMEDFQIVMDCKFRDIGERQSVEVRVVPRPVHLDGGSC